MGRWVSQTVTGNASILLTLTDYYYTNHEVHTVVSQSLKSHKRHTDYYRQLSTVRRRMFLFPQACVITKP